MSSPCLAGPVVKICGLTNPEDVIGCSSLGVWALGFVLGPSGRQVTAAQVREMLQEAACALSGLRQGKQGPLAVGVFTEGSAADISSIVRRAGLDAVQLHGNDVPPPDEVRRALAGQRPPLLLAGGASQVAPDGQGGSQVEPRQGGFPAGKGAALQSILIIEAVAVDPLANSPADLRKRAMAAAAQADLVLFDTSSGGRCGGTGVTFPWWLAREAGEGLAFLVAGGIGPGNVREALIDAGAWGVDVSSGVETAIGKKDLDLVKELVAAVRTVPARRRGACRPAGTVLPGGVAT